MGDLSLGNKQTLLMPSPDQILSVKPTKSDFDLAAVDAKNLSLEKEQSSTKSKQDRSTKHDFHNTTTAANKKGSEIRPEIVRTSLPEVSDVTELRSVNGSRHEKEGGPPHTNDEAENFTGEEVDHDDVDEIATLLQVLERTLTDLKAMKQKYEEGVDTIHNILKTIELGSDLDIGLDLIRSGLRIHIALLTFITNTAANTRDSRESYLLHQTTGQTPNVKCEYEDDLTKEDFTVKVETCDSTLDDLNQVEILKKALSDTKEEGAADLLKMENCHKLQDKSDDEDREDFEDQIEDVEKGFESEVDEIKCSVSDEELSEDKENKCEECNKSFQSVISLKAHMMKLHASPEDVECEQCQEKFETSQELRKHVRSSHNHDTKKFTCEECGLVVSKEWNLKRHKMKVHNSDRKRKCEECGKKFKRGDALERHMEKHKTPNQSYPCPECSLVLTTETSLAMHTRRKHDLVRPYKCHECGKTFSFKSDLRSHRKHYHEGDKFQCDECSKVFPTLGNLTRHKKGDSHSNLPRPVNRCEICDVTFRWSKLLKKHMTKFHPPDNVEAVPDDLKPVSGIGDGSGHRKRKLELPEVCDICGKSSFVAGFLRQHMVTHTEDRPYKCDQCLNEFKTQSSLYYHVNKEHESTTEDPSVCCYCAKVFPTEFKVKRHMYQCTKRPDKLFACEACGKKCVTKGDLKRHIRYNHSDEKPHKCSQCGKAFREERLLKKHMFLHTGEKPFECDRCSKAFALKEYLENHYRTHTGEKPFKCEDCTKPFTTLSAMRAHWRKHHKF